MKSLNKNKKSRIQETKNLLTDADSRTNTICERLQDLFIKTKNKNAYQKRVQKRIQKMRTKTCTKTRTKTRTKKRVQKRVKKRVQKRV